MSANPGSLHWLAQVLPGVMLGENAKATCYYCKKEVRVNEAVTRDNIIMCRECAENRPSMKNAKKK